MKKYQIISKDIEKKIKAEYKQGQKLPSIRKMMDLYQCSRSTIISSYQELIEKHLIYVKPQSGYYVAYINNSLEESQNKYLLNTGNPIVSTTSLVDAKHCLSIAIDEYSKSSLNLSLQGVESLQDILPTFLEELGIYAKKEDIFLIQGITQMLSFLTTFKFNHKNTILIEEPTYSYYIQFLKSLDLPVETIKRDKNGLSLKQLEYLFKEKNIKFFYLTPRNHNPLGTTLNTQTRKKIASLALKYNVYLIEDDYFGHCSFQSHYLPLYYYTGGKNCIYLTSFTKTIPYLRIGICVINQDFRTIFDQIIHQSYYYSYQLPSLISQATLESYIRSLLYQKQTQKIYQTLKKHYQIIKRYKKTWDINLIEVIGDYSGYYFTLKINQKISLDLLEKELNKKSVYIARNERCFYHKEHFNHSFRISLAQVTPEQLKKSLDIIYQTILSLI